MTTELVSIAPEEIRQRIDIHQIIPYVDRFGYLPVIRLMDGICLSVQCNSGTYAREEQGRFTTMEVGFPTARIEELLDYAEDPDEPTRTVYPYVPVAVINDIINKHGGIDALMRPR